MSYPSDLSEQERELFKHYFEPEERRGSGCIHDKRTIIHAILYVLEGGIKWRMLPRDFPPWQTVYDHFSKWNRSLGTSTQEDKSNSQEKKPAVQSLSLASLTRKA